jgi:predicted regulator of Ras-like GTPase activity (Roadblock/LC7/MglB family)
MGFRMPGLNEAQLEQLAQMMSGMQVEGAEDLETETATIGGKEVLRMTTAGETQSVFMYIAGDTFFTVVTESEDLAAELLSQLP